MRQCVFENVFCTSCWHWLMCSVEAKKWDWCHHFVDGASGGGNVCVYKSETKITEVCVSFWIDSWIYCRMRSLIIAKANHSYLFKTYTSRNSLVVQWTHGDTQRTNALEAPTLEWNAYTIPSRRSNSQLWNWDMNMLFIVTFNRLHECCMRFTFW